MATQDDHLHFLIVPLMSQSHLIPMTDLAKVLAKRGLTVTIIITPLNAVRYQSMINRSVNSNLKIQLVQLPFPSVEAGLPEGCENMTSLPCPDSLKRFFEASCLLQQRLEKVLEDLKPRPSCMIATNALPWTADVARRFEMPRVVFHGISCFTLLCSHNLQTYKVDGNDLSEFESFLVPNMPDRVEFTKDQLPKTTKLKSNDMGVSDDQSKKCQLSEDGILVNSFEELEQNYVKGLKAVTKNIWCIGPVALCNQENSEKVDRGNKASIDEHHCLKWLNSMKPRSVIYACFGSLCHLLTPQLIEIGLGLENSNRPFIWIVREVDCSPEFEKWLSKENFEERVNGRGLIIRGWAPQVLILSHHSIGGFLTHCGWNSTMEGVSAGVPMITWPMFAEQFYNEKLIVQVLRIGVRIGVEVCMEWGEEKNGGIYVKKEDIKKAVDEVMDEGEEGEERRKRARELGEMAKSATEEGGSSYLNMSLFIQYIIQQISSKKLVNQENAKSLVGDVRAIN